MKSFAAAALLAGIAATPAWAGQATPPERAQADHAYSVMCPPARNPPARPPELRAITVRRAQDRNTFVITVNARDPDNGALRYLYRVTDGSVRPAGASATWTVPGPGQYTVAVMVFGQNGCTISSTLSTADAGR